MRLLLTLILLYRHRHHVTLGWRRGWLLAGLVARGWKVERFRDSDVSWVATEP